jgi:transposase
MRGSAAGRLDFVPILPAISMPLAEPAAAPARSSPSIDVDLAGAVLRVAPGTDAELLAMVLRAIRASAA